MSKLTKGIHLRIRLVLTVIALFSGVLIAPVAAQAPLDPNAAAVSERQLLQQHYLIEGRGTIADTRSYVLEQPLGRVWRLIQAVWMRWIGAAAILITIAIFAVLYFTVGPIRFAAPRSGRMVLLFTAFERVLHWLLAVSFVILAVTGLNITFGRGLLLPLIGAEAFSRWSEAGKYVHDYSSLAFTFGVAILFLLWVKDFAPTRVDIEWFKQGGGMIAGKHPAADRFNGGQKILFWLAILGTIGVTVSGVFLLFPFYWTNVMGMQVAQIAHALIAVAFVATMIAHVYIAAVGMEGGWGAMASGWVDLNWAKQHHSLWVEREFGEGRDATPLAGGTPPT
ncbi:MAG: formate dehydrogenase subunit gamma [Xanthobacteraceae bacterium]|jgi:formate dehydrogenase subunit gamma